MGGERRMNRWKHILCSNRQAQTTFALSWLLFASPQGWAASYAIPKPELLSSEFTQIAGYSGSSSRIVSRQDVPGTGVGYDIMLEGADYGKLGVGDRWPTDSAAGLGWDPVLAHWTSLAGYASVRMAVSYLHGPPGSDIDVGLIMNTGLTGPSGYPSSDGTNDTFWAGAWITIPAGESRVLTLPFSAAEAWNITDNKPPHTGGGMAWPNGQPYAVNERDRHEVSNIGFQLADFDGDALSATITIVLFVAPSIPSDCDDDGDVDLDDFAIFEACVSGPAIPVATGCEAKDLNHDNDVDQSDFGIFQRCMSGAGIPADPSCVN